MMAAMSGEQGVVECAFVENDLTSAASFFATKVKLGPASAKEVLPFGPLRCPPSSWRVPDLIVQAKKKGIEFANNK